MRELLCLAVAGAAGTLARYGLSGVAQRLGGAGFAWGTLAVNTLGCFLFGLLWTLADDRLIISGQTRFIMLTGFMGAFTTFSTFAFETSRYLEESQWGLAAANLLGQNILGLVCLMLGWAVGRLL